MYSLHIKRAISGPLRVLSVTNNHNNIKEFSSSQLLWTKGEKNRSKRIFSTSTNIAQRFLWNFFTFFSLNFEFYDQNLDQHVRKKLPMTIQQKE